MSRGNCGGHVAAGGLRFDRTEPAGYDPAAGFHARGLIADARSAGAGTGFADARSPGTGFADGEAVRRRGPDWVPHHVAADHPGR